MRLFKKISLITHPRIFITKKQNKKKLKQKYIYIFLFLFSVSTYLDDIQDIR